MTDKDEKPPTPLRLVSENPNAAADKKAREIERAKVKAQRALAAAAANLFRLTAGGQAVSYNIRRDMINAFLAEDKFHELSGQWLNPWEVQNALALPIVELQSGFTDMQYREWKRERGMEAIVQGSLRLAAHQLLDERPHFGGKHSERLIEDGITAVTTAFDPPPQPRPPTKKQLAADKAARRRLGDDIMKQKTDPHGSDGMTPELKSAAVALLAARLGKRKQKLKPPTRKKRWSLLDSRSYLDPDPEE